MKKATPAHLHSIGPLFRLVGMLCGVCFIVGIPVAMAVTTVWYAEKIVPGVRLAQYPVGGKSKEYSEDLLREYSDRLQSDGALFRYDKKVVPLYPQSIPFGSDSPVNTQAPLFGLDNEKTLLSLFSVGRDGSIIQQQRDRLTAVLFSKKLDPALTLDSDRLIASLKKEFSFFHSPAHNADFAFDTQGALTIKPESSGIEFDYGRALQDLTSAMSALTAPNITLVQKIARPEITQSDLEDTRRQAEQILARAPLTVTRDESNQNSQKGEWRIPREEIITWFLPARSSMGAVLLSLDSEKIHTYLAAHIAPDVFVPVHRPRFEMNNGKVVAFELAKNGQSLDSEKTAQSIIVSLLAATPLPVSVTIKEEKSSPVDAPETNFAITDLLTANETSFAGSPPNRRKNIARGAELINGLLVAPKEEFSLVKALGSIDKQNGFLPELVIKGNETKPEFGGGLCQVSTTLFRAVSYAGLSVLERRNHSYRVSYYEPPVGFDATIYDPAPDFRLKNDTPNYLLIQSSVKGSSIRIELWGTNDGRRVEIDKPTVYNIKKAGETKIIETPDLPPGEKKCTERAHNGADAFFERRIFYTDGTIKKETYKSHYIVWPAVCLVGQALDAVPEQQPVVPITSEPVPTITPQENAPPPDTLNGSAP